jgi:hypothetical protein
VGGAVDDDGDGRMTCTADGGRPVGPPPTGHNSVRGIVPVGRAHTCPHKRAPCSSCSVSGAYGRTHPVCPHQSLTPRGMAEDVENAAKSYGVHVKTVYP